VFVYSEDNPQSGVDSRRLKMTMAHFYIELFKGWAYPDSTEGRKKQFPGRR